MRTKTRARTMSNTHRASTEGWGVEVKREEWNRFAWVLYLVNSKIVAEIKIRFTPVAYMCFKMFFFLVNSKIVAEIKMILTLVAFV